MNPESGESESSLQSDPLSTPLNMAVFVSGRGSNLKNLIASCQNGELQNLARIELVVSSKVGARALEFAASAGVDSFVYSSEIELSALNLALTGHKIELIALAGYLKLIEPELVKKYRGRVINIHPALLPKFGGKGMYGLRVHRAALSAGETKTGATVHLVEEEFDSGKILGQEETNITATDTPETLEQSVLKIEKTLYPKTLAKLIRELTA